MPENFKVIIAGAGPVGLVLAHALSLAGIDFVCLEKRDRLTEDAGASLILHPPTLRLLNQLGDCDSLLAIGTKIRRQTTIVADTGEHWDSSGLTETVTQSHGLPLMAFHRSELIECLFERLPRETRSEVHTGKKIVNIEVSDNGVAVSCGDGTSYEGSIVIGADGAHSAVRKIMHRMATSVSPDIEWDSLTPYKCDYICLWCTCPRMAETGQYFETQSSDRSVITISGEDKEWMLLFEKRKPLSEDKHGYSQEEMAQFAANFAEFPASLDHKVGDMFAKRVTAGMTDLQEGMLEHWHSNRVVLVGDACHKMTPNAGFGFNNGVQDVVVLCNNLRKLLDGPSTQTADSGAIEQVFREYQSTRKANVRQDLTYSAHFTRIQAWASWPYYIFARWVRPYRFIQRLSARKICFRFSRGEVLSYVPAKDLCCGSVPWLNLMPTSSWCTGQDSKSHPAP